MKKIFLFAAAAALLTACSSEELSNSEVAQQNNAETPVAFSIYTPRNVTRAGLPKEITTGSLQTGAHKDAGFGVFGYYTDGEDYASANTFPNFMYNQQVKWDGSHWKYEPVKYWPNEYGQSATSDDVDRVTFFSYAPWITVTPSTGVPVFEEMTTDAQFNSFVEGLNITYAKTTEDVVSDQASYIKYLAQNCYTGSTDPADLKLYIEETYHHAAFADIAEAITYVVSLNLKYIKKVETVKVNTLATYQVYIDDINGYAPNTTTAEIAKTMLNELNKKQIQGKNITALTKNNGIGDPVAKYVVDAEPSKSVDLLWGVAAADYTTTWGPAKAEVKKDFPFIDLLKPNSPDGSAAADGKVKFNLRHALAKLNVTVDYFDDGTDYHQVGNLEASNQTKIFIRAIKIGGFTMKGALNLNNADNGKYASTVIGTNTYEGTPIPNWKAYDGLNEIENEDEEVWFKDGRRDGSEGVIGAVASNEKYIGINPNLIQSSPYVLAYDANKNIAFDTEWSTVNKGVTKTAVNLFGNDATGSRSAEPIYVIPRNQDIDIEIIYDVETVNPKLTGTLSDGKTKGLSIKNDIRKTSREVFGGTGNQSIKMQAGVFYTIHIHLGMTSVKTEATVQDWDKAAGIAVLPANQN